MICFVILGVLIKLWSIHSSMKEETQQYQHQYLHAVNEYMQCKHCPQSNDIEQVLFIVFSDILFGSSN